MKIWPTLIASMMTFVVTSAQASEDLIEGRWLGKLAVGDETTLRVVFNLSRSGDEYGGTLDSPDQGAMGIPLTAVEVDGSSVIVKMDALRAEYRGELRDGELTGVFQQAGQRLRLNLVRTEAAPGIARPQDPQGVLPYRVEDVVVQTAAGHQLAGTLTLPAAPGEALTGVVLVSGSGPQDRDETIFAHRPFRLIADRLTRAGVAVLRYDDRGVGGSTGATPMDTTADFADDAREMVAWLKKHPEVGSVGLLGHSEGGLIGTLLGTGDDPTIDFLVSMAGPSLPGDELLLSQIDGMARAAQMPPNALALLNQINRGAYDLIRANDSPVERERALSDYFRQLAEQLSVTERAYIGIPEGDLTPMVKQLSAEWMHWFMTHDPAPHIADLKIPVFAAFGGLDLQVSSRQNKGAFNDLAGVNPDVLVKIYPAMNHLFQRAQTGMLNEYGELTETMAEEVLGDIINWVSAR